MDILFSFSISENICKKSSFGVFFGIRSSINQARNEILKSQRSVKNLKVDLKEIYHALSFSQLDLRLETPQSPS